MIPTSPWYYLNDSVHLPIFEYHHSRESWAGLLTPTQHLHLSREGRGAFNYNDESIPTQAGVSCFWRRCRGSGMSLSSKFTRSFSKQVMESYYSCNQGYAPWNLTPYQPYDLGYDAYQSNGFGDAYYGYEDPSSPYPPSQKGIEELIQLLCQERKEIREIQKQIANQVNNLCSIAIRLMTQSAINNSSSTSQPLNSEDRPSKSLPNPRGCIPTLSRCKGRRGTLSQLRSNQLRSIPTLYIHQERKKDSRLSQPLSNQWRSIPTLFRCAN
ncbi:hypothetical protein PIB30_074515 [Stylosanthes scabra]|uniref:Uncharacterized protein n=1 Tax=Stylosanthes scabra TaxID=79078 RepID=A0ABU6QP97_9FABA|nr:hypothetical protein [Stylosanthes scabra]